MSSAMEIGKKMMEKWGWNKGQGLGKDKQGMRSCLVLKKQDGSSTQGRIEVAAPQVFSAKEKKAKADASKADAKPSEQSEPPPPGAPAVEVVGEEENPELNAAAALCAAAAAGASPGLLAAMGAELGVALANEGEAAGSEEPAAKRQRTEASAAPGAATATAAAGGTGAAVPTGAGLYDIDPRDAEAAGAAAATREAAAAGAAVPEGMAEAAAAVAAEMLQAHMAAIQGAAAQQPMALALLPGGQQPGQQQVKIEMQQVKEEPQEPVRLTLAGEGHVPPDYKPPERKPRIRQYVRDDWRWSKGTEALWRFEEVQLAPSLLSLAKKVLGEGSRYPARISDDTDCVTEVTAWGTLLVRPRGTGANMPLAKRMLFEVLHPMSEDLREEILITPDAMNEAALQDKTLIGEGMENCEQVVEGVERSAHGKLRRVGLGAEEEALADATTDVKPSFTEVVLATGEDATLVKKHLEDLRTASGCTPVLNGVSLKLFGKDRSVRKGKHLVNTLIQTGEWVALTEGFVLSEETKGKRRVGEEVSEQILIKVPEGVMTQRIETHLKAMERAAQADQLKLTSKAVGGKRTLMVEGTKAAHERVKLMVKELSEKGESPMLTKALGVARAAERKADADDNPGAVPKAAGEAPAKSGVISKPPVPAFPLPATAAAEAAPITTPGLGAGPAMRHLPGPRLAAAQAAGTDLFAGLPVAGAQAAAAPEAGPAAGPAPEQPAAQFPPLPPGLGAGPAAGAAGGDLFAGLPVPGTEAAAAAPVPAANAGPAPAAAPQQTLADATAAFIAAASGGQWPETSAGGAAPEAAGDPMDGVTE
mmetsp:Transcript_96710/g.257031  ORF Transcript_96710/g.257031 Transcript_96710/m.257031 type:complete len:818 (-) Transcript_96710:98-2551(-)